jgi:UDP-N-acetyl-D-glucosamine dehydrogenase
MHALHDKGAELAYSDPHVPFLPAHLWNGSHALSSLDLDPTMLEQFDCTVILTDHQAFDYDLIVAHSQSLVDTRNALGRRSGPGIVRLGAPLPEAGRSGDDRDEGNQRRAA